MKNRSWISYAAIAAVLAGLFFFAYYSPRMSQLKTLSRDRQGVEQEVAKLRVQKKQMDRLEKELADLEVALNYLESIIPKQREISEILNQFQQLAYDTRLTITKFTQKTDTPKDYYSEWPLQLEIAGNYHNLGLFFDRLSRFARLFTVERFSIKPLARQTDVTTVTASFTAKTYLFLDEEQIKANQAKARAKLKPGQAKAAAPSQPSGKRNPPIKDRP